MKKGNPMNSRTDWFTEARFGMFIHWGLYALPARGEWVRSVERLSIEEYAPYFEGFDPKHCDMREWARLARAAGMKYAVLTAKHHDGFCLFDSKLTDYKSTNTPAGRDFVREFVEAFRAEGLRVGLYYSLLDWHHPDYPATADANHPMRGNPAYAAAEDLKNFENYKTYLHAQVRELLTNYGRIDIMWFDFSYDDMTAEKWGAAELVRMARELQPHLIIDNRLEGSGSESGSIMTKHPTEWAGDFACPEQMIPPAPLKNELGENVPWEACITMNDHWGFCAADRHFKSAKMLIRALVECVSKNGNLLLNVGPDGDGTFPPESVKILEEIAEWHEKNGSSIHGCGASEFTKPEWGRYTQNGRTLYAHVLEESIGGYRLEGLGRRISHMRVLADGRELHQAKFWNVAEYPDDAFFFFDDETQRTFPLADARDTVVEIELEEAAAI